MKNKIEKIILSICIIWLFINVIIWSLSGTEPIRHTQKSRYSTTYKYEERRYLFYPFTHCKFSDELVDKNSEYHSLLQVYDFTEFLVYGISPLILFGVYKLITNK
ncbi:MAG: hypothetical protein HY063_14840 [Bacteroidetes bacterium]|nr:hypothetical protein [Bacteroidota bacterium]